MRGKFAVVILFIIMTSGVYATELGVNYYHESMKSSSNGEHYIQRSLEDVGKDLDTIKSVSDNIKFYMNPYAQGNQDWVLQINEIAKQKGMHTVVVMNVDDKKLEDYEWDNYRQLVLNACSAFSGKADEFIVGNEISLHSSMSKEQIQQKAAQLIFDCQPLFNGDVSYGAFWYEKDQWKGYIGRIYFNLYENMQSYETNALEMDTSFGSNAFVGEFGEDNRDEGSLKDETWREDQLKSRWKIIEKTQAPVAYVFAYKEPSQNGFGLLTPEGEKTSSWRFFEQLNNPSVPKYPSGIVENRTNENPVPKPAPETPLPQPSPETQNPIAQLSVSCVSDEQCSPISDITDGECRTVIFSTTKGNLKVFGCRKPQGHYELYKQTEPQTVYKACMGNTCVDNIQGFAQSMQPINSLSVSTIPSGTMQADYSEGTECRRVQYNTEKGWLDAKICKKENSYEMYLLSPPNEAQLCIDGNCVGPQTGFSSFS